MKLRDGILMLILALSISGTVSSDALAEVTEIQCAVSSVGWRENAKALRIRCGNKLFWNGTDSTCTHKSNMDTIKLFQVTANASLLSGKSVQIYYEKQGGCTSNNDLVIREMYLLK